LNWRKRYAPQGLRRHVNYGGTSFQQSYWLTAMSDEIEMKCDARNGTGIQVVMQPVQPGKKIYPPACKKKAAN
jgi:hypothetical protein